MILTDIYVPAMNTAYDFQLDETVPVNMIIDEIVKILQKKTGCTDRDIKRGFVLGSFEQEKILNGSGTLQESGIRNGGRLFIV